ncbi:hypothetical protein GGH92_004409 [Coemansia sp. RSA 2673]|nr:hypothetical protein GGH92_004409 [Coemansia sp. RSA 2673]
MERAEPESPLTHLHRARNSLCKQIEKNRLEGKALTEARNHLDLAIATVANTHVVPVVRNPPVSLTVPAPFPVGDLDAADALDLLNASAALDALDAFDEFEDFDPAPAATNPPAATFDNPDSSTLAAAAAAAVLPTAPSVTSAVPVAVSPPADTVTTLAFLAPVAMHATLAANSSAAALVPHTAAMDADSPTEKLDAPPPFLPTVATLATKTNSAVRTADATTDSHAAIDNSEAMAPPAKRLRIGDLQDSNGKRVGRAHVSEACGPFVFLKPQMVPVLLHRTRGCRFVLDNADLPEFLRIMPTTHMFMSLIINVDTAESGVATRLELVQRVGIENALISEKMTDRLRLRRGYSAVVPGPLLLYYLAILGYVPIVELSGTAVAKMFQIVTGISLESLTIATRRGPRQRTKYELYGMLRDWLDGLSHLVVKCGSIKKALRMADKCYMAYLDKCKTRENTAADFDLNGANAVEMLRNNECNSRIFLGIWVDEFEVVLKCLPDLMKGRDEVLVQQLKEITDSHFNQP